MTAPTHVFIDPRVADRLPASADEAAQQTLGDVEAIEYVSMEYHAGRLLELTKTEPALEEWIVQISGTDAILYGLSNLGRTYAYGQGQEGTDGWFRVAEADLR